MSKQIIILEQTGPTVYRYALWASVPSSRQSFYASTSAKSAWTGASATENAQIAAGAVTEKVDSIECPIATTFKSAQTLLQQRWTDFQASVTDGNPWATYGAYWDGTSWTTGGVS